MLAAGWVVTQLKYLQPPTPLCTNRSIDHPALPHWAVMGRFGALAFQASGAGLCMHTPTPKSLWWFVFKATLVFILGKRRGQEANSRLL